MERNEKQTVRRNIGIHIPPDRATSVPGCSCIFGVSKKGCQYPKHNQGFLVPSRHIDFAGYHDLGVRLWQPFLPQVFVGLSEMGSHITICQERETPSLQKKIFSLTFQETPTSSGVIPPPTRRALLLNEDARVFIKYLRPEDSVEEEKTGGPHIRKNTDRHEVLFVHEGTGFFDTSLGFLQYRSGAYVVVPKGIEYRIVAESFSSFLILELKEYPYPVHYVGEPRLFFPFHGDNMEMPKPFCTEFNRQKTRVMHIADKGAEKHFYDSSPFATMAWSGQYYPYFISLDFIYALSFSDEKDSFDRYLTFAAVDNTGSVTSLIYTVRPFYHQEMKAYEDPQYDTLWFSHRKGCENAIACKDGGLILYPRGNAYHFEGHAGGTVSIVLKTKERLHTAQGFGSRAEREGAGVAASFS